MGGHEGEADEGVLRGACRRDDGVDEHALVKGTLGNDEGFLQVSHIERDNWAFRLSNLEAGFLEAAEGVVGHIPELGDALRLLLDNVQGFQGRCRCGGRVGSLEDVGAGGVAQPVDDDLIGRYETADGGQALGEGAHDEVYLAGEAEVVANAAALFAEDAQAVGFIHHDDHVVVLMLEFHNLRQLGQVSFHGEYAIHHDELDRVLGAALEAALQVLHVVVLVVQALGEGESAAVHDGGVVTVVADDEIVLREELGDDTAVHGEAGGEHQGFVLAHELGQFMF